MKRHIQAAAAAVVLAALSHPALAQKGQPQQPAQMTPQQIIDANRAQENAAIERQYERTRRATGEPASTGKADPWGTMRTAEPSNGKPKDKPPAAARKKPAESALRQ